MRAWAVVETGKPLQEIELPTPEPKGAEVLLEVTHCGVCHSDLHIWEGDTTSAAASKMRLTDRGVMLPLAMGHEIVGRVVKLGPDAKGRRSATCASSTPGSAAARARTASAEEDNMCLAPRSLGVDANGGYATHVHRAAPRHLIDPGTLDPAVAATYACSGITVYSAINKALPMPTNEAIVLVGAGGLGLNAIAVLQALGPSSTSASSTSAPRSWRRR